MNVAQPNVPGVNVVELQTRRFKETLTDILTPKHEPKLKFKEGILVSAKANTNRPLGTKELNALCYFADSWNQEIKVARSGDGLKVEFNLKQR